MKAIIMAGGEGTRLRPLTCDCPKPMMKLMDRPVMEYSLELLALHGVTEAAVTLGYLPERIRDYFGDDSHGIELHYYTEQHPLGTAGGVKQAQDFLTDTFCVLSGDGVTDCDLTAAYAFHQEKGAMATMILKHTKDPTPYGLVITEPDGRVSRFTEKPGWGEVVSDAVNTGIYILEPSVLDMIPQGSCDFGRDIFPRLAAEGLLYGWFTDGYWCDIGDIPAYLGTCRDALDGRIALPGLCGGRIISPEARIAEGVHIESPCYIGKNSVISPEAHIGAYSIISEGVHVGRNAGIKRSVVWNDVHLHDNAQLRGCVIGKNVNIAPRARVYEHCAIGTGAQLGTDSEVAPGVCIWPGKSVSAATLADRNLVWGSSGSACFLGGALPVNDPYDALRCAQACTAVMQPGEVLLGRAPSAVASAMWHSCAAGIMAQGAVVIDAGVCTEPQLRYTMELMHTDCALLASGDRLIPLHKNGVRPDNRLRRGICALISRQDFPRPFSSDTRPVTYSGHSAKAYTAMLAAAFCADPALAVPTAVHCEDQLVLSLAEQAFARAGLNARFEWEDELMELFPGEMGIWLSPDGRSVRFSHAAGMLTDLQNELMLSWTAIEHGESTLIVSDHSTRAIEDLAAGRRAKVMRSAHPVSEAEQALSEYPLQLRIHTDGIYAAICALSALTANALTLTGWLSTMPRIHRVERTVRLEDSLRGQTLRRFSEAHNGSLTIDRSTSHAWLTPDDDRPECRVVAEAYDIEAARELCDFCMSELKKLTEK